MNRSRILVAGIGNIFLGDDAFGVEVVRVLSRRPWPDDVRIVDFGIRGLDLAYALLDGYEVAILVDAIPRGGTPGTLYVIEPEPLEGGEPMEAMVEGHNLDPEKVLRLAAALGNPVRRLLVVGCEPEPMNEFEDITDGLSGRVQASVAEAVNLIESWIEDLRIELDGNAGLLAGC
jgi:hydrogenase maturation protease